jgi:transcriptional regulator with XRE-family HTH domain
MLNYECKGKYLPNNNRVLDPKGIRMGTVSSRIKAVREALKISQRDFCKGIYLSHSFYAKIETGTRKPNERVYELISNKYNVNKEWLITGNGDMFSASPPDAELDQLMGIIKELDPLFRKYIIRQIKLFADLHKKAKKKE